MRLFKQEELIILKFWLATVLISGAIAPIFIKKTYVYVASPFCLILLLYFAYAWIRRRKHRMR